MQKITKYLIVLLLVGFVSLVYARTKVQPQEFNVQLGTQEFTVKHYPAQGKYLILWIAPGYGEHKRAREMPARLSQKGVEVWYVDLIENLFLLKNTNTMRSLSGKYVARLIRQAYNQTGKKIILLGHSYGAIPVLRGIRQWQLSKPKTDYLAGAILFSPELYSTIPALGLPPQFVPITTASNIPLVVYQGGSRGNRWQLENVVTKLRKGGAQVYVKLMQGVTGLFYDRDTAPQTLRELKNFPHEAIIMIRLLEKTPTPLKASQIRQAQKNNGSGLDIKLNPYKGNPNPLAINLFDIYGKQIIRSDYKGKITIINFWASWCPPCVQEIPSLNSLRTKMKGYPFELISINYAEDRQHIKAFLRKVNVEFPVLLDTKGGFSSRWNVLVFPSTYVIGPDGKIKYGVNAAIHWDTPEVIRTLRALYK